jgi:hypothetical protein
MPLAATGEVSAGPLGLLVLLLIAVATVLLIRNMNTRLKRMPREFPPPPPRNPHEIDPGGDGRP